MQKRELASGYFISPVIKGGWQLSQGHTLGNSISVEDAVADTLAFVSAGISTLDFGDIYTGVEEIIGKALAALQQVHGSTARDMVQLHTKYVPNKSLLHNFDVTDVERVVDRSRSRLGVDTIDVVQFHWWSYEERHYLKALEELFRLRDVGKIKYIGVTNFDVERLQEMVNAGLTPTSAQIQYSVMDRRAEAEMLELCGKNNIGVLCYGTVAGGFLSERYLGQPQPLEVETRSNTKYQLIIEEFGGWDLYQDLLKVLSEVAKHHFVDISTIASAYILAQPAVKAVIVGARNLSHLKANQAIPTIELSVNEKNLIKEIMDRSQGPSGPVYGLERYSEKHHNIMHTNLN